MNDLQIEQSKPSVRFIPMNIFWGVVFAVLCLGLFFFMGYAETDMIWGHWHYQHPSLGGDIAFGLFTLLFLLGFFAFLSSLSYIEFSERGAIKYFLWWQQRLIAWDDCKIKMYPDLAYSSQQRTMNIVIGRKSGGFFYTLGFYTVNMKPQLLNKVISVLNHYVAEHHIVVPYGESRRFSTDQELDQLPLPPYAWEGRKKRDNMDIKF